MKKLSLFTVNFLFSVFAIAQTNYPTIGEVVRLDPALDALIDKNAKIEVLAAGFEWSEGPAWVKDGTGGYLLFSDVPKNTVYKWTAKQGISEFLKPSGYTGRANYSKESGSNGLTINRKGELVSAEHGDRRISLMPLGGGGKVTLAAHWEGKRFNSPNDVVQHSGGAYYFTDPPYGLPKYVDDSTREIQQFGVYRIATDGKVTQIVSDLKRPNGLAFSPDEKTLYVNQSDAEAYVMAYPVQADGSLGKGRIFYDASPLRKQGLKGSPDGLRVDMQGNLFSTGPGGVLVISPQGKLLGRISTGEATANCAWGDDGSTLYLTADMYLCRIKTKTKGAGW
ncbi:MAG: SMP-30/gluconolactonase/LRE family protein [Cytophagaceae bacterium]|nr:SMP-30/gluconolactonase/LRE family protein [Cytophagaceae bacterium]